MNFTSGNARSSDSCAQNIFFLSNREEFRKKHNLCGFLFLSLLNHLVMVWPCKSRFKLHGVNCMCVPYLCSVVNTFFYNKLLVLGHHFIVQIVKNLCGSVLCVVHSVSFIGYLNTATVAGCPSGCRHLM